MKKVISSMAEGSFAGLRMTLLGLAVMSAAACHSSTTTVNTAPATTSMTGAGTGAADAPSALRGFMDAAKTQNIQGISAYWGDKDGTARGRFPKVEEEQREIIMARCLRHDRYDVLGDAPAVGGGRTFAISLSRPGRSATTNVDVVPASDHRWYVQKVDMEKLSDFCR
jgi:hypothetical protein